MMDMLWNVDDDISEQELMQNEYENEQIALQFAQQENMLNDPEAENSIRNCDVIVLLVKMEIIAKLIP